jgi:3-oxoacyl-[acyl-carrier protein] reductase
MERKGTNRRNTVDLELTGKRAWVVGGSSGLGKAVATALVREGAAVALSARNQERLRETTDQLAGIGSGPVLDFHLDVTDPQSIRDVAEKVVEGLGGLDILVANAGGPPPGTFEDIEYETFAAAYELLLASAFRLTKASLPHLRRSGGCIAYITSSGTKEVLPNLLLSNTMRAGVVAMAKTLSKEVAGDGVRVICVAPGRIATDRVAMLDTAAAKRRGVEVEKIRTASMESIPMGRYGDPQEFGDVVAFLVSERASYITGTTVLIDGGKLSTVVS